MARKRVEKNISYDDIKELYYVNLDFGVVDGKQVKKTKTFEKLKDARQALKEHLADKTKGTLVIPKAITVSQWLETWMTTIVEHKNAETTIDGYKNIISKINSILGNKGLQELKATDLQGYFSKMINSGLSVNTVRKHYDLLNTSLEVAARQDIILVNPAKKTDPPKVIKPEIKSYKLEQLQQLLTLVKGDRLELIVYLGAYYGLRRGEIMGLKWENIDFKERLIYIRQTRTTTRSKVVVKGTKNDGSIRTLAMVDAIYELLQKELDEQQQNKAKCGDAYNDTGYVIVWEDGRPVRPNYVSQMFTELITDVGLPKLTLHGLRHSFASLANAVGVSLYDTSKLLGHSTTATTSNIYTHMYDKAHKEQTETIASALNKKDE